ncbi:MAG: CHASE3 domain-containing protein [Candidatus Sulfotelmatobacter sp.]|jgi:signal transduction histidine kinase
MSPRKNAQVAFASAVAVLFLSAIAAYVTIARLRESARWVVHSFEVETTLGEIDSSIAKLARARSGYAIMGNEALLEAFGAALPEVRQKLQQERKLTEDNPSQQELCTRLEDLTDQRISLFRKSIELKRSVPHDEAGQSAIAGEILTLAFENASIMQQMRQEEQQLLKLRMAASNRLYTLTVVILAFSFALALILFFIHYRLLTSELKARALAESAAREGEESLRQLTSRLLQMQDEERRKFSRELHDSLGQYLAGVKMNLDMFSGAKPTDELLANAIQLLDQSIAETRTISHLLHPPLLDEVGFASAAKWYLQGFSERSGVEVKVEMPDDLGRLPRPLELGLFRVLQESLTNIHRHSKSAKAEVTLKPLPGKVVLQVKDYGKGIPQELLKTFRTRGTGFGVGLTGMRERVRELGGQLEIQSNLSGTQISVTMPLAAATRGPSTSAAD